MQEVLYSGSESPFLVPHSVPRRDCNHFSCVSDTPSMQALNTYCIQACHCANANGATPRCAPTLSPTTPAASPDLCEGGSASNSKHPPPSSPGRTAVTTQLSESSVSRDLWPPTLPQPSLLTLRCGGHSSVPQGIRLGLDLNSHLVYLLSVPWSAHPTPGLVS